MTTYPLLGIIIYIYKKKTTQECKLEVKIIILDKTCKDLNIALQLSRRDPCWYYILDVFFELGTSHEIPAGIYKLV